VTTRWVGWLDECAFLWPRGVDERCISTNPTAQHMCVDRASQHDMPEHTCRCGVWLKPLTIRPTTRRQRRAARDALHPYNPAELRRADDTTTQPGAPGVSGDRVM
jgi:hypothetical protein